MRLAVVFLGFTLLLLSISAVAQDNDGLRFIQNKGQWNENIDFQAMVPGGRVGVSAAGFSVQLFDMEKMEEQHLSSHEAISEATGQPVTELIDGHYFQINLVGANEQAKTKLETPLDGYYNYFLGNSSSRWATHALAYESILYQDVYDGIDFRVSSVGNDLKYDFIVKPGADPSQIAMEYCGVSSIEKSNVELEIKTVVGILREAEPFSYQENNHQKQPVVSEYQLNHNFVSFSFPDGYDECSELVIDPLLIFSTYSGSTADNWGSTATPGEHGTLYSAGVTNQNLDGSFPATVGAFQTTNQGSYDMAIIKYDSTGSNFLYATHLGGTKDDSPKSLVVDEASGDLIVLGISSSPDYPTSDKAYDSTFNSGTPILNPVLNTTDVWDIVLTRLSPTGDQLVGSTFLGGSGNDGLNTPKQSGGPLVVNYGDEMRGDVITDETGNVYISSVTTSPDFPIVDGFDNTFDGATDAIIVKLARDFSSIIWSSYLGGTGFDAAYSIKFDVDRNVVLAGGTTSTDFPATAGAYQTTFNGIVDGWIARIAEDGSAILNATFTGTSSFDQVYFIDLNAGGSVFCYGQTTGNMPVSSGVYNNPGSGQFLQKFSHDLSTLEYSTVFGSGNTSGMVIPNISPTAFLVNDCDNIYMAGWGGEINSSSGFWPSSTFGLPITEDAYQETTSGSDFYFMVLNGNASQLVYSTYLGGIYSNTHVDGGTSRFDKYGIVYHAVCAGCGGNSDFPTTPNAHSRVNGSSNCNNAAFKFDLSSLRALIETNNTALTMPGFNDVCFPDTIVFQNISIGGRDIRWDFGDGTVVEQTNTDPKWLYHQYQEEGQYEVKLKITDLSTCSQVDSTMKVINYFKTDISVGEDAFVCEGESFQLTAAGGLSYNWTSADETFSSTEQSPLVWPTEDVTSYFVAISDANGCSRTDTVKLSLIRDVKAFFQTFNTDFSISEYNNACYPDSIRFKNQSANGLTYTWDFGDGTIINTTNIDTASIFHRYEQEGEYLVKLTAFNPGSCNKSNIATKTIHYFKQNIVVGEDGEICEGSTFQLFATGGSVYAWSTEDQTFSSSDATPLVQPTSTTEYLVTVTDANGCVRNDTVKVRVVERVNLQWEYRLVPDCIGRPSVSVQNMTAPDDDVTFSFDFGDGTTSAEAEVNHGYDTDGTYSLKLFGQREFCIYEETVELPVYKILIPNIITPNSTPGYNDYFQVAFGSDLMAPADVGLTVGLIVVNRWGEKVFESADYKNDWSGQDLEAGVYYVHLKIGDLATCKDFLQILK